MGATLKVAQNWDKNVKVAITWNMAQHVNIRLNHQFSYMSLCEYKRAL